MTVAVTRKREYLSNKLSKLHDLGVNFHILGVKQFIFISIKVIGVTIYMIAWI